MVRADLIDELIDAAFSVLQHDTDPGDPEHSWGQNVLRAKFTDILDRAVKGGKDSE